MTQSVLLFAVVLLLGVNLVACDLGTITVSFTNEDPATGLPVDAILTLGESIEVTVTLSPAPPIPIRLDITSTVPSVIKVSHSTLTFNRGETTGVITLESPEDGRIGVSTIIIKPEKLGYYIPVTFDLLVQGISEIAFVDSAACVAASQPVEFVVKLFPPALDDVELSLTATNGVLSNNTIVIPTGRTFAVFTFNGTAPGPSSITVRSDFYTLATINFNTLGRILTDRRSQQLIEGAPEYVTVNVYPPLATGASVNVNVTGGNAEVSSDSIVVTRNGTQIEIVPTYYGISTVTYTAPGYCPLTDLYFVAEAPICSLNSATNILGDDCFVCPGNLPQFNHINNCNDHGLCRYTHCFDNEVTCLCDEGYGGYACQWDLILQLPEYDSAVLDDEPFELVLSLSHSDPTIFSAPGDLIDESLQPGVAIAAGYPFFGAIDPALNPPMGSEYTGDSFYWENTCYENAYIADNFTAPVSVKFAFDFDFVTPEELLQIHLCLWNATGEFWVDNIPACAGAGLNVTRSVDLYSYTLTTGFCQPGQYALFILPISSPIPNTGNSNNPHPLPSQLADAVFPLSTGWQPAPPLPLPENVNALNFDPSPPQVLHGFDGFSANGASSLVVSFLCLCAALLL